MENKKEELEEKKKDKKETKSNILLITVMITLLLAAFFGFGYAVGGTKIVEKVKEQNKEQKEEQEPTKENTKEFDQGKAKELLEEFGFNYAYGCNKNVLSGYYSDVFKAVWALEKASSEEKPCSDYFTDANSFEYDNNYFKGETGVCQKDKNTKTVSYENANKVYKKLYGVDMPKQSINSIGANGPTYKFYDYNTEKDTFVSLMCYACGGTCGPAMKVNEFKSAREVGNKLYIEVYYFYGMPTSFGTSNDLLYFLETRNINSNLNVDSPEAFEAEVKDKYLDKLDVYEIEFVKQDDHYVLQKVVEKVS